MMRIRTRQLKTKKLISKFVKICVNCGSDKISFSKFTLYCKRCGSLHFFEGI